MCGVPWHSADHHIARLVAAGRKVAICDQVEDPRAAKGLVRRDITRIVTPGTVLDPESLLPGAACYLAALVAGRTGARGRRLPGPLRPGSSTRGPSRPSACRMRSRSSGRGKFFFPRDRDLPFSRRAIALTRRAADWFAARRRERHPAGPAGHGARSRRPPRPPAPTPRRCGPAASRTSWRRRPCVSASAWVSTPPRSRRSSSSSPPTAPRTAASARFSTGPGRRWERARCKDALSRPSLDPVELEARWDAVEELVAPIRRRARALQRGARRRRRSRAALRADRGRHGGPPRRRGAGPRDCSAVPRVLAAGGAARLVRGSASILDGIPDVERPRGAGRADARARAAGSRVGRRRHPRRRRRGARLAARACGADAQGALLAIEARGAAALRASPPARPVQPRLRLLARGRRRRTATGVPADWIRRQSLANAERFVTPALEGPGGEDPRRRRTDRRDRGAALRASSSRELAQRGRPRRRGPRRRSRSSTSTRRFAEVARVGPLGPAEAFARRRGSRSSTGAIRSSRPPARGALRAERLRPLAREADPRRDGAEHGGQVHVPAAGRDDRAARAGRLVRAGRERGDLARGPDLHARRRRRSPLARRVHVHGRDARGGRDPARGDAREAS